MRIILTGTPGTGKSTISKLLSEELGLELIDIKKIVLSKKLANKKHEVDIQKLAKHVNLKGKNNYLVEGHLACEFFMPSDFVVVLRANPKTLKNRLKKRGYGNKKRNDNLMTELIDYCTQRVIQVYKKQPLELDTSKRSIKECVNEIKKAIKQKKKKIDSVNYSYLLLEGY